MEQTNDIGQRIRTIMENLTLKEFAESIGITVRALSYYLAGRTPKNKILQVICEKYGISMRWLRTGDGPMCLSEEREKTTSDMSEVLRGMPEGQPIENIDLEKKETSDMSEGLRLRQKLEQSLEKMVELQERLLSLTEQNAELRLQLERRDMRIHELEKENAGLREASKGAAAVYRAATGEAG